MEFGRCRESAQSIGELSTFAANSCKMNTSILAYTACWTAQAQEEAVQVQAQIPLYKHLRTGRDLRQRDRREGLAVRLHVPMR